MNLEERNKNISQFFDQAKEILFKKGSDYNPTGRAFEDILDTAQELEITPYKVLWVHMKKYIAAIKNFLRKGNTASEPIEERLKDLANYCAMMAVLIKDKSSKEEDFIYQHTGTHKMRFDPIKSEFILEEPCFIDSSNWFISKKKYEVKKQNYISDERKIKFYNKFKTKFISYLPHNRTALNEMAQIARRELGFSKETRSMFIYKSIMKSVVNNEKSGTISKRNKE